MDDQDRRVFMFRGREARLFISPDAVPAGKGWKDAPYDLVDAPKRKNKKAGLDDAKQVTDGDRN